MFAPVKVVLFKAVGFDACKYCGKHIKIVFTATVIFLDTGICISLFLPASCSTESYRGPVEFQRARGKINLYITTDNYWLPF